MEASDNTLVTARKLVRGTKYKVGLCFPFRVDFYLRAKEGRFGMGSIMLLKIGGLWSVSIRKYTEQKGGYYEVIKSDIDQVAAFETAEKIIKKQ
jgi:hypothetical protein